MPFRNHIYDKIYIPVTAKEAAQKGRFLIATHGGTITDEKVKLEIGLSEHLKEQTNVTVIDADEKVYTEKDLLVYLRQYGAYVSDTDPSSVLSQKMARKWFDENKK